MFTILTFLVGLITVCCSVFVAVSFWKRSDQVHTRNSFRLSLALSLQVFGEAVMGLSIVVFALAEFFDWYPPFFATAFSNVLRFFALAVGAVTTIHLWKTIRTITHP